MGKGIVCRDKDWLFVAHRKQRSTCDCGTEYQLVRDKIDRRGWYIVLEQCRCCGEKTHRYPPRWANARHREFMVAGGLLQ